jgi:hypothetical protein
MPDEFATLDVLDHPEMDDSNRRFAAERNYRAEVGKTLKSRRTDLGIAEIGKGTSRGSIWRKRRQDHAESTARWEELFANINQATSAAGRALHKPLLLLYGLGRLQRMGTSVMEYAEVEPELKNLFSMFGASERPEYPFHRLQADGMWTVSTDDGSEPGESPSLLRDLGARGRFLSEFEADTAGDPTLVPRLAQLLLDRNWPPEQHGEVAQAVGVHVRTGVAAPSGGVLQLRREDGTAIDAELLVEPSPGRNGFDLILFSRGGTRGTSSARNPDYAEALEEILRRFAGARAVIASIVVDSSKMRERDESERVLALPFPLRLDEHTDIERLRAEISRAQTPIGQAPGAKGGNSTKQIRMRFEPSETLAHAVSAIALLEAGDLHQGVSQLLADEIESPDGYIEGSVRQVYVNALERSGPARQACIDHYGAKCAVCGFDFGDVYGEIGDGFIHVHHLADLALRTEGGITDPTADLRPVCPNCHAMLHTAKPARDVNWLRDEVESRRATQLGGRQRATTRGRRNRDRGKEGPGPALN